MSPVRYAASNGVRVLCLFTGAFSQGGIQRFNRCLIKALCELMPDPVQKLSILSLADQPDKFDSYYLGKSAKYKVFSGNRSRFISSYLKEPPSNITFIGHINFAPLTLLRSSKNFLVVHGIDAWRRLDIIKRIALLRIDKILSVSDYTKRKLISHNVVADNKFSIFPNCLDPRFTDTKSESIKLPAGKIMLSVSRLDSRDLYKGIDHTIVAMRDILEEVPDTYYLVVGDGDDRPRLEQLAHANGVEDRVVFLGSLSDGQLRYVYEKCDLFILPSRGEGFGIVVLEAFFMRKPVIAANAGALPEIVNSLNGALVTYGHPKEIAHIAVRLLKNQKLRTSMGESGYRMVMEKYTFDAFKSRLLTLLKRSPAGST